MDRLYANSIHQQLQESRGAAPVVATLTLPFYSLFKNFMSPFAIAPFFYYLCITLIAAHTAPARADVFDDIKQLFKQSKLNDSLRILISGGGTGGHIFPAIAIANAIKARQPDANILFVGARGRMEMQRVPAAGYVIVGLPVRGLIRPLYSPRNVGVMIDFARSRQMVKKIIRDFCPQVAVGVGGYASAPTLNAAHALGIPCLIQEQNSYAGVTNKSLAKKARRICVAYEGMERFFPAEKIRLTGNPVRQELLNSSLSRSEALSQFGFTTDRPAVLIIGGSLGARTLNEAVVNALDLIANAKVNFILQTGAYYKTTVEKQLEALGKPDNLFVTEFIADMSAAYTAASLVISRAGAGSISELCLLAKPSILVPSPNVAEDHQTANARALATAGAALLMPDDEALPRLIPLAIQTVTAPEKLARLSSCAARLALPDAADNIAAEVLSLIDTNPSTPSEKN